MSELNKGEIDFLIGFLGANIIKIGKVKKEGKASENVLIELSMVAEISAEIIVKLIVQKEGM